MERVLQEHTTEADAAQGLRRLASSARDAADQLDITIIVRRREEVSLDGEPLRYEPTGNLCTAGQLADELTHLIGQLNQHRWSTRLPH